MNEAKNSSSRMADGDEIERLMCSGQTQHPLHFAILECAYWNRSQIHCDGLQEKVLSCVTGFEMNVSLGPSRVVLLCCSLVDPNDREDSRCVSKRLLPQGRFEKRVAHIG